MNKLELDSFQLSFGHRQILTDCFLECSSGDIIGILGRNGSGKSSLFEIVFGKLKPGHKFIRINGEVQTSPFKKRLVAYLPQKGFLPKNNVVSELLSLVFDKGTAAEMISNKRIEKIARRRVGTLSGGELKYLEVFIILHMKHPFVLLDEPFSGIEPLFEEEITSLIKSNLYQKGILLTDHHYQNVLTVCNQLFLLKDGALIKINDNKELEIAGYVSTGTFN